MFKKKQIYSCLTLIYFQEIIAGMLDLDHSVWKNPKREYGELQRKKVMEFINEWKQFERSIKN